jgi:hypothetical protein
MMGVGFGLEGKVGNKERAYWCLAFTEESKFAFFLMTCCRL